MALTRSAGARKDTVRGTVPIEVRKAAASRWSTTGVVAGGASPLVVGTGALHRFQGAIPTGSTVLVDTARGAESVLMDGVSDRSGQMTRMDPIFVPAGGSIELAFVPLGTTSAATATFTITPGSW